MSSRRGEERERPQHPRGREDEERAGKPAHLSPPAPKPIGNKEAITKEVNHYRGRSFSSALP